MGIIPDKLQKQLEELIKGKFVVAYRPTTALRLNIHNPVYHAVDPRTYNKLVFYGPDGMEVVLDQTKSVAKTERPMVIADLFSQGRLPSVDQNELKYLFELEKEVEELRKLKQSVETIKDVFNKGGQVNG